MKKVNILSLLLAMLSTPVVAQQPDIKYEVEAQATGTTNDIVPFWMRSNQFGSIPSEGASGSFIGRVHKEYENNEAKKIDWGVGFEGRANAGSNSKLLLIEAYGKVKAGIFQFKAGRTKDIMGFNGDSTLTSGNFSVSGNALGIPKVDISIPNFYSLPILDGLFAFKGNFAHGWMGKMGIRELLGTDQLSGRPYPSYTDKATSYLHQKSLYGRLGRKDWNLKIYGGFNHQTTWGNEDEILGPNYDLNNIKTLFYVTTGKAYGTTDIARSKIGNHIGSIDIGFEYQLPSIELLLYRQNFYETGALAKLANIKDGLNGLTVKNRRQKISESFHWKTFLIEFLYTKNQAGELDSKRTNSGDEDYYNNYIYNQGWAYKGIGLGTPLLSTRKYTRDGLKADPSDYFINNRVVALHLGASLKVFNWDQLIKLTYSKNHGTYATSIEGRSTGPDRFPPKFGIFQTVSQFSAYLEGGKQIDNGLNVGYTLAIDRGSLLKNAFGVGVKVSKRF